MWKVGQKLVYIDATKRTNPHFSGTLTYGDICTVEGYHPASSKHIIVHEDQSTSVSGSRAGYPVEDFRPLLGDSAKAELISSFKEVTETSDLPIKTPQTA